MCWGNIRTGMYREGCRTAGVRVARQGSRGNGGENDAEIRQRVGGRIARIRPRAHLAAVEADVDDLHREILACELVAHALDHRETARPEGVQEVILLQGMPLGAVVPEIPGGRLAENASLQALAFAGGGVDASLRGRAASHVSKRRKTLTGRESKMGPTVPTRRRAEDSAFLSAPRDSIAYLVCKKSMPVS